MPSAGAASAQAWAETAHRVGGLCGSAGRVTPASSGGRQGGPRRGTEVAVVEEDGWRSRPGIVVLLAVQAVSALHLEWRRSHVRCRLYLLFGVRQEAAHHLLLPGMRSAGLFPRLLLPPPGRTRRTEGAGSGPPAGRRPGEAAGAGPVTRRYQVRAVVFVTSLGCARNWSRASNPTGFGMWPSKPASLPIPPVLLSREGGGQGHQNRLLRPRQRPQPPGHFKAVHPRQGDLQKHHIGAEGSPRLQRRRPVVCHLNLMPPAAEECDEALRRTPGNVHDENVAGRRRVVASSVVLVGHLRGNRLLAGGVSAGRTGYRWRTDMGKLFQVHPCWPGVEPCLPWAGWSG